ncbi:hypothetical protein AB0C52_12775 [Streptomyces sp. NPDC048717]|uniref:hypothetical protein n=1 Tax=Streptomyces sp. NPDC048717 TaxID=3154928 RepID=UPI003432DA52
MTSTAAALAANARTAYDSYATFPHREPRELLDHLAEMSEYARKREQCTAWPRATQALEQALNAFAAPWGPSLGLQIKRRRAAIALALDAIGAFEHANSVSLPYDDHGRYAPEPGTEYPFSISDIGRAAVKLLGPTWHAESHPWGVGARLERDGVPGGFTVGVDDESDLYVADDHANREYLLGVSASDGLPALAAAVADTVRAQATAA